MNAETFPFRAVRVFAASSCRMVPQGSRIRSIAVPKEGPDSIVTTYHRTRAAAEKTAASSTHAGYCGILKSGRVEDNV